MITQIVLLVLSLISILAILALPLFMIWVGIKDRDSVPLWIGIVLGVLFYAVPVALVLDYCFGTQMQ